MTYKSNQSPLDMPTREERGTIPTTIKKIKRNQNKDKKIINMMKAKLRRKKKTKKK